MSHDDFNFEPIPGLPERPPEGEEILWQGAPSWSGLALRVFHLRKVSIYFTILLTWVGVTTVYDGGTATQAMYAITQMLPFPVIGIGLLAILTTLYQRTTIYTITNKRVVMRFGIALSLCVGFPFKQVKGASLRECGDGTGDIVLQMTGPDKIAYLNMWPFARPWQFKMPEPMLRSLPEAQHVATLLKDAYTSEQGATINSDDLNTQDATDHPNAPGMVAAE